MRQLNNNKGPTLLAILLTLLSFNSLSDTDELTYGGFVSQGIVYTSDNTFFDEQDNTSFEMTELALQANYRLNNNIRFSGQTIYRHWGKSESLLLDYLMADYQMALANNYNLGVRIGRIKSDLGLVNATRDIPQARPSVFLPQSVYQDVLRDTTTSYDGISLYGNQPLYQGRLSWSFAYGKYPSSDSLNKNILDQAFEASVKPKENIQLMATWESPDANWIFSLGYDNPEAELYGNDLAPVYVISDGKITYDRYLASVQYFSENWDFTFEYINQATYIYGFGITWQTPPPGYPDLISPPEDKPYTSDGFYGQLRYILNNDITLLSRYERYATDVNDRDGQNYEAIQTAATPYSKAFLRYHHDLTLGLKWTINSNWLFHAEAHLIEGTATIAPILKIDRSDDLNKHWQLYTAQLSYSF